ncbi:MAG TPA: S41 family peptidase [Casimicrobiaceae bacterium]|nr:S41 family peptidase [Casimicrobiaceae bacterium]
MDEQRGYLRFPAIRGDAIVFVSDDDLWRVGADGGIARRLTASVSEASTPALSPDGRTLAFVGRDEQHPEVYVMSAEGGPARRLTWLGPDVIVRGFTPDGQILFVSTYGQPFFRNYRAFTLDPAGGLPKLMPLGQVNHLSFGPNGGRVIGRNTADPARWKRYRGGTAGHLWIDATGNGTFTRMREPGGNITSPMWIGERVYFLSDHEGVGNLYSCKPDGSGLVRHTDHDDFYARHAQTDGKRVVYQCGATLWLFDAANETTRSLDIRLPSHRTQAARRFVPASEHIESFRPHPEGHSVALTARGKVFSFALWEGAVRQLGDANKGRYRHAQWLGDGNTLVAIGDASGEERVETFAGENARQLPWDIGRVVAMRAAPRDMKIAIANHRNDVLIGDIETGKLINVDHSDALRTEDLAWSPDGKWLAYTFWTSPRHCAIKLFDVAKGTSTLVTQPEFRDYAPAFDPEGRYLYFLSLRTFDPVYDSLQFELSFPRGARPYLIALQARGKTPFEPMPKGLTEDANGKRGTAQAKDDDAKSKEPLPRIDLDGIARRVAPFPVPENRYGQIGGVAGDKVIWSVLPIAGAHGRGGHKDAPGCIELFDFATARAETLIEKADAFELAGDHVTLLIREGKRLRAVAANKKRDLRDASTESDEPMRKTGWIDLERVRLSIEPRAEWKQMLREVWRLQRDQFWVPNMSGVDWDAVYAQYEPLLARVTTRAELSDLIWEMQGELGTSHAYEMGGDHRKPPQVALGYLAAEVKLADDGDGYEITHIAEGDAWDAGADSPLNAAGVEAEVGERIVAVNGQRVSREVPPQALLVHQAKAKIELTLASGSGKKRTTRDVLISTLADEVPARYREWVEAKRAWVHEKSRGRVGYFHLPDMMSAGFAEFHRYFRGECDRDALIVDVRYNRGGHVSELLLEKVARKRIGYNMSRWSPPASYPDEAAAGPVVALANEHAGSDGDIFSHGFKLMKVGPLVGTRTWGGVIGIWPRHKLVDGTETTQPEFSFWFRDVEWGVENYGTDPTIEVDNAPQDAREGRDRQLERALATALELIERGDAKLPGFERRPNLARTKLPPRKT